MQCLLMFFSRSSFRSRQLAQQEAKFLSFFAGFVETFVAE